MKKIIIILLIMFLTACHSIPEGEVNSLINKYQSLDKDVVKELKNLVNESSFPDELNLLYEDVYKRQYSDLTYQIMDYKCNNKICDIPVEIEVYDYNYAQKEALNYLVNHEDEFEDKDGYYNINKYEEYKLGLMNNTYKRIKYTINIKLKKEYFNWNVVSLDHNDLLKIHGIYE